MSAVKTKEGVQACPQCKSTSSWGENSWCPECGYYPKFAGLNTPAPEPVEEPEPTPTMQESISINPPPPPTLDSDTVVLDTDTVPDMVVPGNLRQPETAEADEATPEKTDGIPSWAKVLAGGIVAIILGSIAVRVWIHINGGRRALFAIGEMLTGVACILGGTIFEFIQCRKSDKDLSVFAIVMHPIDLWRPAFEQMPETRKRVWILSWGITMIFAANILVGGIKYSGIYTNDWGFEQPKTNKLVIGPEALAGLGNEKDVDLEQVIEEYRQALAAGQPVEPPTVDGIVYGVLADGNLEMGRILVARRRGKLKHCATILGTELEEDDYDRLLTMVSENLTTEAPVSTFLNATWVKPIIRMKLTFADAVGSELVDPRFHSLEAPAYKKEKKEEESQDESAQQESLTDEQSDSAADDQNPEETDTENDADDQGKTDGSQPTEQPDATQ